MSPVTRAAKERLLESVQHALDESFERGAAPEKWMRKPGLYTDMTLTRLVDDLIAAVRGEQPTDNPFSFLLFLVSSAVWVSAALNAIGSFH